MLKFWTTDFAFESFTPGNVDNKVWLKDSEKVEVRKKK